jgi:hypothetical protein
MIELYVTRHLVGVINPSSSKCVWSRCVKASLFSKAAIADSGSAVFAGCGFGFTKLLTAHEISSAISPIASDFAAARCASCVLMAS